MKQFLPCFLSFLPWLDVIPDGTAFLQACYTAKLVIALLGRPVSAGQWPGDAPRGAAAVPAVAGRRRANAGRWTGDQGFHRDAVGQGNGRRRGRPQSFFFLADQQARLARAAARHCGRRVRVAGDARGLAGVTTLRVELARQVGHKEGLGGRDRGAYDADIELGGAADHDGPGVPCYVVTNSHDPSDVGADDASRARQEAEAEERNDHDTLPPGQLQAYYGSNGQEYDKEVGACVDRAGDQEVPGLVEAVPRRGEYVPEVGQWPGT